MKIIQYVYIVFSLFFFYDAYTKQQHGENPWLSVIIAIVALGMFFFRRHFYNKHQNRNK